MFEFAGVSHLCFRRFSFGDPAARYFSLSAMNGDCPSKWANLELLTLILIECLWGPLWLHRSDREVIRFIFFPFSSFSTALHFEFLVSLSLDRAAEDGHGSDARVV